MSERLSIGKKSFMRKAIHLSEEKMHEKNGGPFGAVIVKDGQVIAEGFNQVTSMNDPTAHAEIVAIRKACQNLNVFHLIGAEIYCSCEPCPMCLAAIYWAQIEKIYYSNTREDAQRIGFDDNSIYEELTKDISKRRIPIIQILPKEGKTAFQAWVDKIDKIHY
ncbi:MAG: nucleoside deaminase [Candidatus Marinimicrobia bacterium]|jgi:tRNA(Arg) A34 adenosine deaminase TadA|nr:nucleoside deaminase [Candidatus Neomarinimicrobiota bacterium]|tara:strand:+ start:1252 stop:1740 length:489 start_codon:yes stop_codon:yes gene_type:complete